MADERADDDGNESALRQQRKTHALSVFRVQADAGFDHIRQDRDDKGIKKGIYEAQQHKKPSFLACGQNTTHR